MTWTQRRCNVRIEEAACGGSARRPRRAFRPVGVILSPWHAPPTIALRNSSWAYRDRESAEVRACYTDERVTGTDRAPRAPCGRGFPERFRARGRSIPEVRR